MVRDRDGIHGDKSRHRVSGIGIDEVLTAPRSPWQNPYAERLVGSVRRVTTTNLLSVHSLQVGYPPLDFCVSYRQNCCKEDNVDRLCFYI